MCMHFILPVLYLFLLTIKTLVKVKKHLFIILLLIDVKNCQFQ